VEVGDGAPAGGGGGAHAHAARDQPVVELLRRAAGARHVEEDDVRLDLGRVDGNAGDLTQAGSEQLGVGVVLGQALDVVLQRVDARRGDDPGLAHRPAEHVLVAPRPLHRLPISGQHGADRAAEALGEVDPDSVDVLAPDLGRDTASYDGVQQAGTVQVNLHAQPVG